MQDSAADVPTHSAFNACLTRSQDRNPRKRPRTSQHTKTRHFQEKAPLPAYCDNAVSCGAKAIACWSLDCEALLKNRRESRETIRESPGLKDNGINCMGDFALHQNQETLVKETKRLRDLSSSSTPAGKKRKRPTCSAEEGVYCQLDDCGLCFDLKRTLFKNPVAQARDEEKKRKGGGDDKNCYGKCHYGEVMLEQWARSTRSRRPIRSKKAARNYRRRERKRQERWENSDLYKEEEWAKVTSVILAERVRGPVHYATPLAEE